MIRARDWPGRAMAAGSLSNLGIDLAAAGRHPEAATEQAHEIFRRLAEDDPGAQ